MKNCAAVMLLFFVAVLRAELVRVEVQSRQDVLDGQAFGKSGPYELIRGRAHFAVDPSLAANRRITDIRFAPRNGAGKVEFSADMVILRPRDPGARNGTLLLETPNRGAMGALSLYNRAKASLNPTSAEHFGDGFLMREGFTVAWVGWQHDVPLRDGLLRAHVPVAPGIEGVVRGEMTPAEPTQHFSLGDNRHVPYVVSDPKSLVLTVRDGIHEVRSAVPESEWRLDGTDIVLTKPATPGRILEFVYRSKDPAIAGLGLAAVRDFVAAMKHGRDPVLGSRIRYAIGIGTSQSAMALKALLYEGFNADERGRKVFDGLQPHVAGGRRSTFERFTQPSRTSGPYRNASYSTTDQFPFSDAEDTELATGRKDSVLSRARVAGVVPKIVYTNSSYEYWGSAGALVHTSLDGSRDLKLPSTTRLYLLAGGQHGPAAFPPRPRGGQNLANWNDYRWILRAILLDLQQWVERGIEPPPSSYPSLAAGTLVKGSPPAHRTQYLDFGPEFLSSGIVSNHPPRPGLDYVVLVPKAAPDGNDSVGVKMPWVAVPLGAFTGWNLRNASIGGTGQLLANTGSYLPFTMEEIRTRFQDRADFLRNIEKAARQLARDRFLLEDDVARMVDVSATVWDWSVAEARGL